MTYERGTGPDDWEAAARVQTAPEQPTRVVHISYECYDVKIDRSTIWGNPFNIGMDGDRDEVCDKYVDYLNTRPDLIARLGELRGRRLGCWCKHPNQPFRCHGDTLAFLADIIG